ncbi:phosphatidylserine decarboxylase proenzyme, mitochondrial-like isoform X1 [Branchiostoma lanceolatum]|uniref:phosphatidylserine decarboxylase proenzyme, mitochondrial-like isoform X1 n=1 Tax=Branchiostoma lanceolatum TaxID=7740 RepID=UPI00345208FE
MAASSQILRFMYRGIHSNYRQNAVECRFWLYRQRSQFHFKQNVPALFQSRHFHESGSRSSRNGSQESGSRSKGFRGYLRSLKWYPIPLAVGFAYISYQQYGHIRRREDRRVAAVQDPTDLLLPDWTVQIYRKLPLRLLSRLWGHIHKAQLPVWMRGPLLRLYIWLFDCNLQEAAIEDLTHYSNLNEFFRRQLKPSARTIDQEHSVVSPADGTVLHFGKVEHNMLEQVKGVTYSLQTFLGRTNNNWWLSKQTLNNSKPPDDENYQQMLLENPEENELYHCTVYLAPGDYHRFHSPAEWEVLHRRHFPGELFSVNPGLVRCIQGLFNYNERVVMSGRWDQGFFSMSAVGATNVGSIRMYMDSELHTNLPGKWKGGLFYDRVFFNETQGAGVAVKKGEIFGEFNLGSSIVIIFEAPRTFSFKVKAGQKIRFGEPLGCFAETDQTKVEDIKVTEMPEAVDNGKHKEE